MNVRKIRNKRGPSADTPGPCSALRELALRSARATKAGPSTSFAFAAACVLLFVFGPILIGVRTRPRDRARPG